MCPYDYIINPATRKGTGIILKNSTIVFDEAHNLDAVAEDIFSSKVKISDLMFTKRIKWNDPNLKKLIIMLEKIKDGDIFLGVDWIKALKPSNLCR